MKLLLGLLQMAAAQRQFDAEQPLRLKEHRLVARCHCLGCVPLLR